MSDDEEVLNKGNELYKHLLTLGYTEFETFVSERSTSEHEKTRSCIISSGSNTDLNDPLPSCTYPINLSYEAHQTVLSIITSKLMFVEDIEFLEALVLNSSVKTHWPIINRIFIGTLSLSFLSWALYYKIGTLIQVPLYVSGICSLISFWYCKNVYVEKRKTKLLRSHIESLKQLCICIQKTFRFLTETEILATGQVSTQNVSSAMYVKTKNNSEDLKELPSWKILPQLRMSLFDALEQIVKLLLQSCGSFSHCLPFWVKTKQRFNQNFCFEETFKSLDELTVSDSIGHISLKNLQSLIEVYLDVQSEYLKIIASCLFPHSLCQLDSPRLIEYIKLNYSNRLEADFFEILSTVQSKTVEVNIKLKIDQDIHNQFRSSVTRSDGSPNRSDFIDLNHFQVQLHSIFLLLEFMLLRVRNFEDVLEDISNKEKSRDGCATFKESLFKQMSSIRNDFQSTMKEFDNIYNHFVPTKPPEVKSPKINWEEKSCKKSETISTGILLGLSDFSINNPDEVFLATSETNEDFREPVTDDFGTENLTKMPKTLISELSATLKSIRKDFRARERLALERIGLDGVENLPSDDEVEDEDDCGKICKRKKGRTASDSESYTESEIVSEKEICEKDAENLSDSKKPVDIKGLGVRDDQSTDRAFDESLHVFNNSSLANLVALKSKMWGNMSEECFTDE